MTLSTEMLTRLRGLAALADTGGGRCCEGCRCSNQAQIDACNGLPRRDAKLAREILTDLERLTDKETP